MAFTKILLAGDATAEVIAEDPLSLAGVVNFAKNLNLAKSTSAVIDANDEIAVPTTSWHYVTCTGTSDSLDGIGAGTEGQIVFLTVVAGKDVTLVHNGTVTAGKKLMLPGEANYVMDQDHDMVIGIFNAVSDWWDIIIPGTGATLSSTTPLGVSTAAGAGSGTQASKDDHVHDIDAGAIDAAALFAADVVDANAIDDTATDIAFNQIILTPKATGDGVAVGTLFYDSDDDHPYIFTT